MKRLIFSLLVIGLSSIAKAESSYLNEDQVRQIIQTEIQRQEMKTENDEALKEMEKKRDEKHNWSPDNDTTKQENKTRHWDASRGEFVTEN